MLRRELKELSRTQMIQGEKIRGLNEDNQKQNITIKNQGDEILTLIGKNKRLEARFKAFEARIYARGRSDKLTERITRNREKHAHYKQKVNNWHKMIHPQYTEAQIASMKKSVGKAYSTRREDPRVEGQKRANSYGSMNTGSLRAVGYALARNSNKESRHAVSSTRQASSTINSNRVSSHASSTRKKGKKDKKGKK
jgi:hypothetical protein